LEGSFYIPLHVSTYWHDFASSKLKKTTIDIAFATEQRNEIKIETLDSSPSGLLCAVFSRNRELVEKAAAGHRGLIWRWSPADLS